MADRYLIIGALKENSAGSHAGGILTATESLVAYARAKNISVDVLNVYSDAFAKISLSQKIIRFFHRLSNLLKLLRHNKYSSALIFCSYGLGFIERIVMVLILKFFGIKALLYMVSGHFINQANISWSFNLIARLFLKIPNAIGVQGDSAVDFFHKELHVPDSKLKMIRNWLPKDTTLGGSKLISAKTPDKVCFIFVGWLVKEKGVLELIEAVKSSGVLRKNTVKIIGGGTLESDLKQLIRSERLSNIKITGWLTHKQTIKEMQKAHVLVLPSYAEGFPNVVLEAMSQGLAIITTDVGGLRDAVTSGKNGYLIPPKDLCALRETMEKLTKNYKKIPAMGKEGIKIVKKNYSYEKNCMNIFRILENL